MRSFRFGLGMRIFFGFGFLVAALVAIAVSGSYGLSVVGGEIRRMDNIAGSVRRVQEITFQMEAMRRGLTRYRFDADAESLQDVISAEKRSVALLDEAAGMTISGQKAALYNSVAYKLRNLAAKRERFMTLLHDAVEERKVLAGIGTTMMTQAIELADAAGASKNPADWVPGASVRTAFLTAEAASSRFLAAADVDPRLAEAFHKETKLAEGSLIAITYVGSPEIKAMLPPVQASLKQYIASFDRMSSALIEGARLYDNQIRNDIRNVQTLLMQAQDSLEGEFSRTIEGTDAVATGAFYKEVGMSGGATLAGIALALLLARAIIRPIRGMTHAMTRLAAGDATTEVPARGNTDELGEMARTVEVFRQQAIENQRLAVERDRAREAKDRQQAAMDSHTEDFSRSIAGVMQNFIDSANAVRQAASAVTDGARQTGERISSTMEGASASARDLNAVAAAAEEVAASINEISQQVSLVTASVQSAVSRATETDAKVAGLAEAGERIGEVVRIITDIAGQTNLLALNATIEAARAGEAGKGFAVVAGEVKALASQTARATEQIGAQIVAIRGATADAVTAVRDVGAAIGQVETVATAIAAAVEQQAAATREITNSVQLVTATSSSAAEAMHEVLLIAENTDATSVAAAEAADEVGTAAATLRAEMADFLTAMSHGSEAERRLYERIDGNGMPATIQTAGQSPVQATIKDIARGGMAILHDGRYSPGTDMSIGLPGGSAIRGRVIRAENGTIGFAFRQDAASLAQIDRALAVIARGGQGQAA
ncbi:methyl-accepting chemotaxis protein [Rhodopila globiformis]|nr:methyl-accepting chemotaxis protein [Rhodopila globiformis]